MTMPANTVTSSVTIAAAFSGENVKSFFIKAPQAFAHNIGSREVCIPPPAAPGFLWNIIHADECRGVFMSLDRCTALACSRETSDTNEYDTQTPVTGANG